jgi:uncharacterized protein (DUF488 family)
MAEKRIVKRMATCNSCAHFKEAESGHWIGYTPVCTQLPTQIGINKYKKGSEKTVTWLFNCTEALFCPNYKKANDDYVSRVRKGMELCHPDTADKPYNQIYKDKQYYKTEDGKKVLRNLGVKGTLGGREMTKEKLEKEAGDYAEKHAFRVPYDGSNKFYDDIDFKASKEGYIAGAKLKKKQIAKLEDTLEKLEDERIQLLGQLAFTENALNNYKAKNEKAVYLITKLSQLEHRADDCFTYDEYLKLIKEAKQFLNDNTDTKTSKGE